MLKYQRRKTYSVKVGNVTIGSGNNIVVQSMTNTDTFDVESTVNQVIKIVEAGADIVRITAQNMNAVDKLEEIKTELSGRKFDVPLVADIHFSPKAAEKAAEVVEKVRVNPGNYTDSKKFSELELSEQEYSAEIEKIREKFVPLIAVCKKYGRALRIGANHGSLSDRIMSKYGDTPEGMVESTLEFLRICKEKDFQDVVISMKASNPLVMMHACRMLVVKMEAENMYFPIHLGVTEAGEGIPGRVKSVSGIASILADGIGDTIRVSLTESPEFEIPVVKKIIEYFNPLVFENFEIPVENIQTVYSPFSYKRRKSFQIENIGNEKLPVVIADFSNPKIKANKNFSELKPDYFIENSGFTDFAGCEKKFTEIKLNDFITDNFDNSLNSFLEISCKNILEIDIEKLRNSTNLVLIANLSESASPIHAGRFFFSFLEKNQINNPVIIKLDFDLNFDDLLIKTAGIAGALFNDGMGDGLCISGNCTADQAVNLCYEILQASRSRISKTEYISCPSCGRTLFDLQKTSAAIRAKTSHLKHLKIGIMGCIVNGPGEMADADYGYVGTGKGKVTLYKKQEIIKKNIPEEEAVEELLKLIESYENGL